MFEVPKRKQQRLKEFDYSQNGAYFVTICTRNRECIFWNNWDDDGTDFVGANRVRPQYTLSHYGKIVDNAIIDIPNVYSDIRIEKYVIMPNHIHMIILICKNDETNGRTRFAPTISRVVKQTKGRVTKQIGFSVWQRSYYDHVIRNQADYDRIWQYIDENPIKWELDEYFMIH